MQGWLVIIASGSLWWDMDPLLALLNWGEAENSFTMTYRFLNSINLLRAVEPG